MVFLTPTSRATGTGRSAHAHRTARSALLPAPRLGGARRRTTHEHFPSHAWASLRGFVKAARSRVSPSPPADVRPAAAVRAARLRLHGAAASTIGLVRSDERSPEVVLDKRLARYALDLGFGNTVVQPVPLPAKGDSSRVTGRCSYGQACDQELWP